MHEPYHFESDFSVSRCLIYNNNLYINDGCVCGDKCLVCSASVCVKRGTDEAKTYLLHLFMFRFCIIIRVEDYSRELILCAFYNRKFPNHSTLLATVCCVL